MCRSGRIASMRIALYGAPGRIGSRIASEAISRDHVVTGMSRSRQIELPEGVRHRHGDAADADDVARIAAEHDVVVSRDRAEPGRRPPQVFLDTVQRAGRERRHPPARDDRRIRQPPGVAGAAADGCRAAAARGRREAETQAAALELLRDTGALVDWLYMSPANRIGPGERTGVYRIGHETPIGDWVSAEDFAVAVVDEIETPRYRRTHINIAT